MKHVMIWLIGLYRKFISPLKRPCCRYTPTCSAYAIEAFRKRGFFIGFILSTWRVLRCNPFSKGGYDPVPEKGLRRVKNAKPPEWIDCECGCDDAPEDISEEAELPCAENEISDTKEITADHGETSAIQSDTAKNAASEDMQKLPADTDASVLSEDTPRV